MDMILKAFSSHPQELISRNIRTKVYIVTHWQKSFVSPSHSIDLEKIEKKKTATFILSNGL